MDYHVRPFPQQPKRGGKELNAALQDLEKALGEDLPDLEKIRDIQTRIHAAANHFNDDRLVDMLRMLSGKIDSYVDSPEKSIEQTIAHQLMQIQVALKHL